MTAISKSGWNSEQQQWIIPAINRSVAAIDVVSCTTCTKYPIKSVNTDDDGDVLGLLPNVSRCEYFESGTINHAVVLIHILIFMNSIMRDFNLKLCIITIDWPCWPDVIVAVVISQGR